MRWPVAIACLAGVGCGRIGFDSASNGGDAGTGADADAASGGCGPAIGLVQASVMSLANGECSGVSCAATFTSGVLAGDLVVVTITNHDGGSISSVSGGGVTWMEAIANVTPGGSRLFIYYGIDTSGGTKTVAVNGASDSWGIELSEWAGVSSSTDGVASNNGTSAVASTGMIGTTTARDLLVALEVDVNFVTVGPQAPFSALTGSTSSIQSHSPGYQIVSATGVYGATWNLAGSINWAAAVIAFSGCTS
jgi:hypothetical protein